mgnify:CR=1 FL=1
MTCYCENCDARALWTPILNESVHEGVKLNSVRVAEAGICDEHFEIAREPLEDHLFEMLIKAHMMDSGIVPARSMVTFNWERDLS